MPSQRDVSHPRDRSHGVPRNREFGRTNKAASALTTEDVTSLTSKQNIRGRAPSCLGSRGGAMDPGAGRCLVPAKRRWQSASGASHGVLKGYTTPLSTLHGGHPSGVLAVQLCGAHVASAWCSQGV